MSAIKPLPSWAIINRFPAFYDIESLTSIEQTARLYAKVGELIDTYNRYVTEINGELTDLEAQVVKDLKCAIETIVNLTESYITEVDLRLTHQDRKLDENYKAFTDNVIKTIEGVISQMREGGELDQVILDSIDNLNTKFDNLQTGVAEEMASLRASYEAAKDSLDAYYEDAIRNLDTYFAGKMDALTMRADDTLRNVEEGADALNSELKGDVEKNNYFRKHTSQLLVSITDGDGVGYGVPEIGEYSLVGVLLRNGDYCICRVEHHKDGQYYVRGIGYGEGGAIYNSSNPFLRFSTVDIALNADGDIVAVKSGHMRFLGTESGIEFTKGEVLISQIDGLVIDPGKVS